MALVFRTIRLFDRTSSAFRLDKRDYCTWNFKSLLPVFVYGSGGDHFDIFVM